MYISPDEIEIQRQTINSIKDKLKGHARYAMVETYGCQQNVNDSQRLEGMLLDMGFSLTDDREKADVIIFNTCAIRENAHERVYGNLGALKHLKLRKPHLIIGICGCMVQQEHIAKRVKSKYRHVDLIFGTHVLWKFPTLLLEVIEHNERILDISGDGVIAEGIRVNYDGGAKAFVLLCTAATTSALTALSLMYVAGKEAERKRIF